VEGGKLFFRVAEDLCLLPCAPVGSLLAEFKTWPENPGAGGGLLHIREPVNLVEPPGCRLLAQERPRAAQNASDQSGKRLTAAPWRVGHLPGMPFVGSRFEFKGRAGNARPERDARTRRVGLDYLLAQAV